MFDWIGDAVDWISDGISGLWDNTVGSAVDAITDEIWDIMFEWLFNLIYGAIADLFEFINESTADKERVQLVRAMEMLARAVNDEDVFMYWLISGVADGDINENTADEDLEYYTEDRRFSELMDTFLKLMSRANNSGGLYADGVVSNDAE